MTEITSLEALQAHLAQMQALRCGEVRCRLSPAFAARVTEGQLRAAFDGALTLVQGRTWQLTRHRGGGATLVSRFTWREGLRMAEGLLTVPQDAAVLAAEARRRFLGETERAVFLCALTALMVRYTHTAPGRKGYERLVCASGALAAGEANCQGFADAVYLLGQLAGLAVDVRIGPGERGLHAWNAVRIGETWYALDASRASRMYREKGLSGLTENCLIPPEGGACPLSVQCIQKICLSACDFFHDFARNDENPPFPKSQDVI